MLMIGSADRKMRRRTDLLTLQLRMLSNSSALFSAYFGYTAYKCHRLIQLYRSQPRFPFSIGHCSKWSRELNQNALFSGHLSNSVSIGFIYFPEIIYRSVFRKGERIGFYVTTQEQKS